MVTSPVVLTEANYLGTLAAARDLGRHGIPVTLVDSAPGLASESRYVRSTEISPPPSSASAWTAWMLEFGRRAPGHVLLPTSDDVCWAIDAHQADFAAHFHMYLPRPGSVHELLNKRRLYQHCKALGIDQPEQWTASQASAGAQDLSFPLLLKPPTQAGLGGTTPKALVVSNAAELDAALARSSNTFTYTDEMLARDPLVADFLLQAFHPEGERHIYSLAGFYAPEQDIYVMRASEKVLQHPMRVGVGLCFESRSVDPAVARRLRQLLDRVGYRGPFEVEFIHEERSGKCLLIDVNPRFYGQMEFEIARGLPIPRLCYFAALGRWDEVRALVAQDADTAPQPSNFRNAWLLRLYVTTHLFGGNMSLAQWRFWHEWSRQPQAVDAVQAPDDPAPAKLMRRSTRRSFVRNPRSTLRKFFVR